MAEHDRPTGEVLTTFEARTVRSATLEEDGVIALRIGDDEQAFDIAAEPGRPAQSARALRELAGEALALAELVEAREARASARRGFSTL